MLSISIARDKQWRSEACEGSNERIPGKTDSQGTRTRRVGEKNSPSAIFPKKGGGGKDVTKVRRQRISWLREFGLGGSPRGDNNQDGHALRERKNQFGGRVAGQKKSKKGYLVLGKSNKRTEKRIYRVDRSQRCGDFKRGGEKKERCIRPKR